jgi:hypothetical protein
MRRVFLGGLIGALPGLLIALVPLALTSLDVITSDQSQIGFIGVPLILLGALVGTSIGARGSTHPGKVMLGVGIGFVVGLAGGIALNLTTPVPLAGLFLVPAAMISGGVLGAWRDEHTNPPHLPAAQL